MNKILIIGLLVSLVCLGFTVQQQASAKQAIEHKIEVNLKSAFPYLQQASDELLNKIQRETYSYNQFAPLEEQAFTLNSITSKQFLSIDKTGQFDIDNLDYKPFITKTSVYLEMQNNVELFNVDSFSNSLKENKLYPILSKTLLLHTRIHLMNYLYGQTWGHYHGSYYQIGTMSSINIVELNSLFQAKIANRDYWSNNNYRYKILLDGKPLKRKFNYKTTPTQIGKHEYHIEVKDRDNKTVFEDTHHFFVENCKSLKQHIDE